MILSQAEKEIHQVLVKKMSLKSFEQWLYENKTLESNNSDLHLELISFDYSSEGNFNYFYDSFAKYVHFYKFEGDRIKEYLYSIINRDEKCGDAIHAMYHLYHDDYKFLERLGMAYGVRLTDYDTSIPNDELNGILDDFYPDIISNAKNVLGWLEEGKIVFKGQVDSYDVFEYEDLRSEAEILQGKA